MTQMLSSLCDSSSRKVCSTPDIIRETLLNEAIQSVLLFNQCYLLSLRDNCWNNTKFSHASNHKTNIQLALALLISYVVRERIEHFFNTYNSALLPLLRELPLAVRQQLPHCVNQSSSGLLPVAAGKMGSSVCAHFPKCWVHLALAVPNHLSYHALTQ